VAEYVIFPPPSAFAHLPRKQRREALKQLDRAAKKAAKLIRDGHAHLVDVADIPPDAVVHGGPR